MGARKDKLKGVVMQIEGRLTGDRIRVAQGTAEKTKGDIEGALARAGRRVKLEARRVGAKLQRKAR